ncbi:RodZ domain-containing protein [Marinomonas profundi]|nr:RodZ domain-containing protein [Marinomonas profundi]
MTTEFQTDASVNTMNQDSINIGKRLKTKRIELEFDERHVATELKITIDQVRALEANNFTYFRSVTFARGFLKSYCRLLGVDHTEMLGAFDSERVNAESTIKPVDKVNKQTHLGDPIVILISIVIVAVLVFLVFWWPSQNAASDIADEQRRGDNHELTESEASERAAELENITAPSADAPVERTADDAIESADNNQSDSNQSNNNQSDNNLSDNKAPEIADNTLDEPLPSQNAGGEQDVQNSEVATGLSAETMAILEEAGVTPNDVVRAKKEVASVESLPSYVDEVEMVFDADCWTEVRDATGKILFSGVKTAGSQLSLTGSAPYRVVLGYARGVSSLKYKGESFDFSSFIRNDLARFELK